MNVNSKLYTITVLYEQCYYFYIYKSDNIMLNKKNTYQQFYLGYIYNINY